MAYTEKQAYLELHVAVFLWGFTAILGDWISLNAVTLVWWRVLLTSLSLVGLAQVGRLYRDWGRKKVLTLAGIGLLIGLHWVCFYGSIKLANASIALICMATTSLFSSLLEPWIVNRPFVWLELVVGVFVLPGIYLIAGDLEGDMLFGVLVGLVSAFLAALFSCLNKAHSTELNPQRVTFVELGAASLFLPLFFPFQAEGTRLWPNAEDWILLIILALFCTTLTFILSLRALRKLSAFATNLTINLEPVYGIILAYYLLDDAQELDGRFYLGAGVILVGVFGYPVLRKMVFGVKGKE
ncbi:MAG: DMT family transporter [Bacteroidota bacterium]